MIGLSSMIDALSSLSRANNFARISSTFVGTRGPLDGIMPERLLEAAIVALGDANGRFLSLSGPAAANGGIPDDDPNRVVASTDDCNPGSSFTRGIGTLEDDDDAPVVAGGGGEDERGGPPATAAFALSLHDDHDNKQMMKG
jgi:hypothetical protein